MGQPFRPNLTELICAARALTQTYPGKRLEQKLRGQRVQGGDASSGLRPAHRQWGLARQHLGPGGDGARLSPILRDLQRWRELARAQDCVSVPAGCLSVTVCFQWAGFAQGKAFLLGQVCLTLTFSVMHCVLRSSRGGGPSRWSPTGRSVTALARFWDCARRSAWVAICTASRWMGPRG